MTQLLHALCTCPCPEESVLIPCTHLVAYDHLKMQFLGIWFALCPLQSPGTHGTQIYTLAKHLRNNLFFQFYSKTLPNLTKLRLRLGWAVVHRSHRVLVQADCSWQELSSCGYRIEVITSVLLSTRNYFYQLHIKFHNTRSPQEVHEYAYFHQGYQRTCRTVNNPYPPNWWLSCL